MYSCFEYMSTPAIDASWTQVQMRGLGADCNVVSVTSWGGFRDGAHALRPQDEQQPVYPGRSFLRSHPGALTDQEVADIATVHRDARLRSLEKQPQVVGSELAVVDKQSPDERIDAALVELREQTASELLDLIMEQTPVFFEQLVLDLLHALGYGTSRSDLSRVGTSGDGGIDGIISLDRLGLEKVYIQAKRWHGNVGRPDVQALARISDTRLACGSSPSTFAIRDWLDLTALARSACTRKPVGRPGAQSGWEQSRIPRRFAAQSRMITGHLESVWRSSRRRAGASCNVSLNHAALEYRYSY